MIEQFMVFISRVVFKRNAGLYEEAQVELDGIIKDLLDIDPDSVFRADRNKLLALLESEDDEDRLFILGRALEEKARIGAGLDMPPVATGALLEYAVLFLAKSEGAGRQAGKRKREIEGLAAEIANAGNLEAAEHVITYYEDIGRFDKAEDFLFELIPSSDEGAIGLGKAFYIRLRGLSDENLEKGGLPRVEVEEGFEYLLGLEGRADLPP
jgi:hypothetical protein